LISGLILGTFLLVVLYNRMVNFNHNLSATRSELQKIQAQNAELKDKVFSLFDSRSSYDFEGKLIQDKNPQYLEIDPKWSFASRF